MDNNLYKEKDEIYSNVECVVVYFKDGNKKTVYTPCCENMLAINVSEFMSTEKSFIDTIILNYKCVESVSEFANVCGFNSSKTFTRYFQKYLGTTPKQWMLQMNKRNVIQQLENTKYSFVHIARNIGFSSTSHLYHFCVNKIGKTPSEIRNEC